MSLSASLLTTVIMTNLTISEMKFQSWLHTLLNLQCQFSSVYRLKVIVAPQKNLKMDDMWQFVSSDISICPPALNSRYTGIKPYSSITFVKDLFESSVSPIMQFRHSSLSPLPAENW